MWLGDWAAGAGNTSELVVTFALPAGAGVVSFGAAVLVGAPSGGGANASTPITLDYDPAAHVLNATVGAATAAVPLLPGDAAVDVHIFVDNTFIEVFVMEGRAAFTASITSHGAEAGAAGMELFASAPVQASAVHVYHLEGIWVSAPEVLASAGGAGR